MYQSPIDVIVGKMQMKFENDVFEAVQKIDILVDKEELVKALRYDRAQYEKGYDDGLRERNEWISVEERLPEEGYVLVCTHKGSIFKSRYDHAWCRWSGFSSLKITHWMPLPEPPKGGSDDA